MKRPLKSLLVACFPMSPNPANPKPWLREPLIDFDSNGFAGPCVLILYWVQRIKKLSSGIRDLACWRQRCI